MVFFSNITPYRLTSVVILGTQYKVKKCWLAVGQGENLLPKFGFLIDILVYGNPMNVIFVCKLSKTIRYNCRFGAFEVDVDNFQTVCFFATSLKFRYLFSLTNVDELCLIKSKYNILNLD